MDYVKTLFTKLGKQAPQKIPYATAQTLVKLLAYRLGRVGHRLPHLGKKPLADKITTGRRNNFPFADKNIFLRIQ